MTCTVVARVGFPRKGERSNWGSATVVGEAKWKQGPRKRRGDEVAKTPNSTRRHRRPPVSRSFQLRTLHKLLRQQNKGCSSVIAVRLFGASVAVAFDRKQGPRLFCACRTIVKSRQPELEFPVASSSRHDRSSSLQEFPVPFCITSRPSASICFVIPTRQ